MEKNDNPIGELVASLKDITRMLEAVRYTAGLGRGQIERLEKAKALIAKHEQR